MELLTYDDLEAIMREDNRSGVDPFSQIESELGITQEAFETFQQGNLESAAFILALSTPEEAVRAVCFSALRLGHLLARLQAEKAGA